MYTLVNSIIDAFPEFKKKKIRPSIDGKDYSSEQCLRKMSFDFFEYHTGKIEVSIDNNLSRVYFPIKPVCRF